MTSINQLISTLEEWFKKLPALPANAVDVLVAIAPWIALIFGVLGVLGGISALGAISFLAPFAMMGGYQGVGPSFITVLVAVAASVVLLMAFPGLKAKKKSGWMLLFWSELINVVATVLSLSIGGLLGVFIGLYLLFQIKPKYN